MPFVRQKVKFSSDGVDCAAWHYRGSNGACVVMAGGFAVTKEPGTDRFASRFHEAGFSVLAFDYRRLGESDGQPRLVLPIRHQLADWQAAIGFAAALPEVEATRLAVWGFSASGGHVIRVAARNPQIAAAIAQSPGADGLAATRAAAAHQKPLGLMRFTGLGVLDAIGGLLGRQPRLVPLVGKAGTVAMLTTPDAQDGDRALNPGNLYPQWQQRVAARSALRLGFYRPGRDARKVRCPLLVVVCEQDQSAPVAPAVRAAMQAPRGRLVRLPGGHYGPFLDNHDEAVEAELAFLREELLHHDDRDRVVSAEPRVQP